MKERAHSLAQYEQSLATLRGRRLPPHKPVATDGVKPGVQARYYEADMWPRSGELAKLRPVAIPER